MHYISDEILTLETIKDIVANKLSLMLSEDSRERINRCRNYIDERMKNDKSPVYGVNTGFGALYNVSVSEHDLEKLQCNLVTSHACGMGDEVPKEIVRLMLLLKIQSLSYGHSGVQESTVDRLIDFYNHDMLPVIYEQGSLGASGDLAPLAHLSLPLIELGEVNYRNKKMATAIAYSKSGLKPVHLKSKEGLALLNGTQFMSAYGVACLQKANHLIAFADIIAALSLDAFDGRIEPFYDMIQSIRSHPGQVQTALNIRSLLEGSELIGIHKVHVQDPYSFRCIPQVHGASRDCISYAQRVFTTEINSVTDNPTIFPQFDEIISAGNFHGQPLALALDFLSIGLSELGSISERRTFKLVSGQRGLPPFLIASPGLNSGLMIPQYTAASIVSQNKQLCTPCSVDTIDSSNGQEDHVSMGANAATKTWKVVNNLERILAIELLTASQALAFRSPKKTSPALQQFVDLYRERVSFISEDRVLFEDMETTVRFMRSTDPFQTLSN